MRDRERLLGVVVLVLAQVTAVVDLPAPERVAAITGLDAGVIEDLARTYATTRPADRKSVV